MKIIYVLKFVYQRKLADESFSINEPNPNMMLTGAFVSLNDVGAITLYACFGLLSSWKGDLIICFVVQFGLCDWHSFVMQLVMSNLRGEASGVEMYQDYDEDEAMRGVNDQDWELWEEWMGWEGAGIRDYSSHINPYI